MTANGESRFDEVDIPGIPAGRSAADEASFMTGGYYLIDGGYTSV